MCGESVLVRRLPDGRVSAEVSRRSGGAKQLPPHPDHFPREDLIGDWAGNWVQQHLFAQAVLYWALGDAWSARELADDFATEWVKLQPAGGFEFCKDTVIAWVCVWLLRLNLPCGGVCDGDRKGVRHAR